MTPALSTLTPDTIGSHYGNGGRFDPGDDGLREALDLIKNMRPLIEPARLREEADAMEGKVYRMPVRQIVRRIEALSTLTRTDEASTDGEGV